MKISKLWNSPDYRTIKIFIEQANLSIIMVTDKVTSFYWIPMIKISLSHKAIRKNITKKSKSCIIQAMF